MTSDEFDNLLSGELTVRSKSHQLRNLCPVRVLDSTHVQIDGATLVNFCSNNYLGLTHHPAVVKAWSKTANECGVGSSASPLISGYTECHASAEAALAAWKGTEAAVLLPSGYQANHAAIQTLSGLSNKIPGGIRFIADKLVHASILDAVRGSGLPLRVFPHNHLDKLRRLLADAGPGSLDVVLTESIFSMDGDAADLEGLIALKKEHPFLLLFDEAHGSGVYGPAGSGYAAERGLADEVDISIITLSKALGCSGGAICASAKFCNAVVNFGRALIFSTSIPASAAAAAEAAIRILREEPQRQKRLRKLARETRARLAEAGFKLPSGDSPILPIIFGSESSALSAAEQLREQGILALAVRPPTVPPASSRLRITLSCDHTDEEIERLIEALIAMKPSAK